MVPALNLSGTFSRYFHQNAKKREGLRGRGGGIDEATLMQVISYFDTMADVVREVPQHVLAQPPHIISSFTQEEKKSMPKVFTQVFKGRLQILLRRFCP